MKIFKKISFYIILLLITVIIYVFLLLGEPNDINRPSLNINNSEIIDKPCNTMVLSSNINIQDIVDEFGVAVLSKDFIEPPIAANLSCEKLSGGFVYKLNITYTLKDELKYTISSLRPIQSIYTTDFEGYRIITENNVVIAGMHGVWSENTNAVMIVCGNETTSFKIIFPKIEKEIILNEISKLKLNEPR